MSAHTQRCLTADCSCAMSWNDAVAQANEFEAALERGGYGVPPNRELELLRRLETRVRERAGVHDLLVELDAVRAHG